MQLIEVDFEVYKKLTNLRETEEVTYNDVLRKLLGLSVMGAVAVAKANPQVPSSSSTGDWVSKGVKFPEGTEFRSNYKGKLHTGVVSKNALILNGNEYTSPSAAAKSITNGPVNGWMFWECKFPGKSSWEYIYLLRTPKIGGFRTSGS